MCTRWHDSNVGDALADQPPCRTDSGVTAADDQYIEKPITRHGIGVHPQALPVMHAREPLPFTRQRSPSYGRTEYPADLEQTDATIGSGGVTVSSRRDVGATSVAVCAVRDAWPRGLRCGRCGASSLRLRGSAIPAAQSHPRKAAHALAWMRVIRVWLRRWIEEGQHHGVP